MSEEIKSLDELNPLTSNGALESSVTKRESVKDSLGRSYATGKRKDAVARVWIKAGVGKVIVHTVLLPSARATSRVRHAKSKVLGKLGCKLLY